MAKVSIIKTALGVHEISKKELKYLVVQAYNNQYDAKVYANTSTLKELECESVRIMYDMLGYRAYRNIDNYLEVEGLSAELFVNEKLADNIVSITYGNDSVQFYRISDSNLKEELSSTKMTDSKSNSSEKDDKSKCEMCPLKEFCLAEGDEPKDETEDTDTDNVMKLALDSLGDKALIIAMEELGELQQAISKLLRGKPNYDNLAEEVADVLISLNWITESANISSDDVENWLDKKINRMKERLDKGTLD